MKGRREEKGKGQRLATPRCYIDFNSQAIYQTALFVLHSWTVDRALAFTSIMEKLWIIHHVGLFAFLFSFSYFPSRKKGMEEIRYTSEVSESIYYLDLS